MSDKLDKMERDAEGFIVLQKKQKFDVSQRIVMRRQAQASPGKAAASVPLKGKKAKGKKDKGKKPQASLLYWIYDDGRTIGSIVQNKKDFSDPRLLKNETDIDKSTKALEKQGIKEESKTLEIPVGIEEFSDAYHRTHLNTSKISRSAFDSFRLMTQEGKDVKDRLPILKLISVILSSYIIQSLLNYDAIRKEFSLDPKDLRAMNVNVSPGENTYYYLERLCGAMIVNTAVDDDGWSKLETPRIISPKLNQDITEFACLRVRGYKEYRWPAPYRDTSVLFDCRAARNKDLTDLVAMNPWCSFIIYGKKDLPSKMLGYSEHINGNRLTFMSLEWDAQAICCLVEAYVAEIPMLFSDDDPKFFPIWLQSGQYLARHIDAGRTSTKEKLSDVDRFKLRVEVTALFAFLQFAQRKCEVPDDDMEQFKNSLLEILLPGCTPKANPPQNPDVEPEPAQSMSEIFEELMQRLLTQENLIHFYPLEDKNNVPHPEKTEEGIDVWGYIKAFKWEEKGRKVPCLIFFMDQLVNLSQEFGLHFSSTADNLNELREKNKTYIHKSKTYKFRPTPDAEYIQPPALRLKVADLPVSDDVIQALIAKAAK